MATYSARSKHDPEQVIQRALIYFGEAGLGLEVNQESSCCATFTGGGGHVWINAVVDQGKTLVQFETREWDLHVRNFIGTNL